MLENSLATGTRVYSCRGGIGPRSRVAPLYDSRRTRRFTGSVSHSRFCCITSSRRGRGVRRPRRVCFRALRCLGVAHVCDNYSLSPLWFLFFVVIFFFLFPFFFSLANGHTHRKCPNRHTSRRITVFSKFSEFPKIYRSCKNSEVPKIYCYIIRNFRIQQNDVNRNFRKSYHNCKNSEIPDDVTIYFRNFRIQQNDVNRNFRTSLCRFGISNNMYTIFYKRYITVCFVVMIF